MQKLYEGKAKILYQSEDPEVLLTYFKDDATAFNAQKKGQIKGKGEVNCTITAAIYRWLEKQGISTHFIEQIAPNQMTVKSVKIIPLEVVVRNIASGSLCKQTGLEEGTLLSEPLVDFYLKDDALGDPLLTSERIRILNLASQEQVNKITEIAKKVNRCLQDFFLCCDITLVDFKLEFGLNNQGQILLADEISPDTCRLWDMRQKDSKNRVLDKDRFRKDLGDVEAAYYEVRKRVLSRVDSL
jgi:phosphoribosylaminoimidazole-succinocarboxamide synthase